MRSMMPASPRAKRPPDVVADTGTASTRRRSHQVQREPRGDRNREQRRPITRCCFLVMGLDARSSARANRDCIRIQRFRPRVAPMPALVHRNAGVIHGSPIVSSGVMVCSSMNINEQSRMVRHHPDRERRLRIVRSAIGYESCPWSRLSARALDAAPRDGCRRCMVVAGGDGAYGHAASCEPLALVQRARSAMRIVEGRHRDESCGTHPCAR